MSEQPTLKKAQARDLAKAAITTCPRCGNAVDDILVNRHESTGDPGDARFYFLFVHGEDECRDFTTVREFPDWLAKATTTP